MLLERQDKIKENRLLYKTAFNVVLNKYVSVVYDQETDNYLMYSQEEDFLGRCSPKNLKDFNF